MATVTYIKETKQHVTLGHADISTTLNIYADVTKELKREQFAGLDAYFATA